MKERQILFSDPMVRAILSGQKTQTRRVVKAVRQNNTLLIGKHSKTIMHVTDPRLPCPYGQPGDRLWVREAFQPIFASGWENGCRGDEAACWKTGKGYAPSYRATDGIREFVDADTDEVSSRVWPSIHMPRWACRIVLEIVSVRVERLHDITRGDCMAEGCPFPNIAKETDPKAWFFGLWSDINGPGSWEANPWLWVIEFKRVAA